MKKNILRVAVYEVAKLYSYFIFITTACPQKLCHIFLKLDFTINCVEVSPFDSVSLAGTYLVTYWVQCVRKKISFFK